MRPWISEFPIGGRQMINFVIHYSHIGKLVERLLNGERNLNLVINEMAFIDAILAVMDKKLWLSKSLDPHHFETKLEIVR